MLRIFKPSLALVLLIPLVLGAPSLARADDFDGHFEVSLIDPGPDHLYAILLQGTVSFLGDVFGLGGARFDRETGEVSDGQLSLIDGNGDHVLIDFAGEIDIDPETGDPYLIGQFSIVGGDGAWEGISGDGILMSNSPYDAPIPIDLQGTFTLP
jgi:hypothetical protein